MPTAAIELLSLLTAAASILFFNIGGSMSLTRTELKRVRPFDERFEVQIGNLKAIDF